MCHFHFPPSLFTFWLPLEIIETSSSSSITTQTGERCLHPAPLISTAVLLDCHRCHHCLRTSIRRCLSLLRHSFIVSVIVSNSLSQGNRRELEKNYTGDNLFPIYTYNFTPTLINEHDKKQFVSLN
jgi:hypothetical protein